ncbi:MAG: 1-carboxybiuret hydrolase subunit AtzG-like [Methylobacteriaceae bacterium]|nr:1-carboxybiuret hydrolase subunit AtzG-like [Methylobacteriaceae bacterium]
MKSEKLSPGPALDPTSLKLQVDGAIASAGLTIEPEWRPGIDAHFEAIAKAAALVMEFPLEDELDPGPVFAA